jgi:hypothetical protein
MFGTVGIGATADATNRLAVAAPATLLTHAGAGHQLKLNKAAPGDTASLLFQTGWSGRAEMGTAGNDSLSIRVSADGAAWATALTVAAAGARVAMPGGIDMGDGSAVAPALAFATDPDTGLSRPSENQIGFSTGGAQRALLSNMAFSLDVPMTGTAVVQSSTDAMAGRILTVGYGGLGTAIVLGPNDDLNALVVSGLYYNPTVNNTAGNNYPISSAGALLNIRRTATNWAQKFFSYASALMAPSVREYTRSYGATGWSPWVEIYHQGRVIGSVSQSGGIPTGAVIETGTNANGRYTRFADGTQICSATLAASSSADVVWTFPAAFATGGVARHVLATPRSTAARAARVDLASSGTSVGVAVHDMSGARQAGDVDLIAIGRWFA